MVAHNFGALAVTSSLLSSSVSHLCSTFHGARNKPPKVAVVGIFTERDYIQKLALSDWKTTKVTSITTSPLEVIQTQILCGCYQGWGCLHSQETRIFRSDFGPAFRTDWEMLSDVARSQRSAPLDREGDNTIVCSCRWFQFLIAYCCESDVSV